MGREVEEGVTRVLLVDDSPVDRRVVQLLLSSNACAGSFHVIAVDSAKKAIEFLGLKEEGRKEQEQAIDMVLTDYCMPEMTGYELLKAIKALSPLKPIPVIVMSSENEPQRISRCLNAGAEDFIVKPLQSKDVQRLRNCSSVNTQFCNAGSDIKLLPSDHIVVDATAAALLPSSRRRVHFAGVAMASPCCIHSHHIFICYTIRRFWKETMADFAVVLRSSSVELSHYFPFLFKFILLVYAILCLGELLHRWSNGCFLNLWCA
uniref:Response regulatory domain-containing protein n=1 Tax=Leersia perrieri TaxID=77586 RepID=A0A0D9W5D2_9ORYZ